MLYRQVLRKILKCGLLLIVVGLLTASTSDEANAGVIGGIRKDLKTSQPVESSQDDDDDDSWSSCNRRHRHCHDDDDCDSGSLFAEVTWCLVKGVFSWTSAGAECGYSAVGSMGENGTPSHRATLYSQLHEAPDYYYSLYPYQHGNTYHLDQGNYERRYLGATEESLNNYVNALVRDNARDTAQNLRAFYGYDLEGTGVHLLSTTWRSYHQDTTLDIDFDTLLENIDTGFNGEQEVDSLFTGSVMVSRSFFRRPRFDWRVGCGVYWLGTDGYGGWGLGLSTDLDFFLCKPLVLSLECDLGLIGSFTRSSIRTTIGANWKHCEVFGGYEMLTISDTTMNFAVCGWRLWF